MKTLSLFLLLSVGFLCNTFGTNHPPVAVNDTIYGYIGYPIRVNLLKNDYDPDGDSIYVVKKPSFTTQINDTTWEFLLPRIGLSYSTRTYYDSVWSFFSIIKDEHGASAPVWLVFIDKHPPHYDSLDINNINALISPFGEHFWDLRKAHFEVPKGSGIDAIMIHTLWIGGLDPTNQLHLAGERYRPYGGDFEQGPISTLRDSSFYKRWNHVWKLTKQQIQNHIANWDKPFYHPIDAIKNWPANGIVANGETAQLAPFFDLNANGIYEPMSGEYPLIRGDESVFFVFNDSATLHYESRGATVGLELHGMAYAYDKPDDSLLKNTLFFHYDIINRSSLVYHDTYIGLDTDYNLGNPYDNYMGTDVTNGMIYAYNGKPYDNNAYSLDSTDFYLGYGSHPPAVGMKIIGGPYLPIDGIDNPSGQCDYGINGLNFGDNIVDNERMGMTNSMIHFPYYGPTYFMDPIAPEYYNFMKSIWQDGTHLVFGGLGLYSVGGVGPDCEFMLPGNTDTLCNLGTHGLPPHEDYNTEGKFWTEGYVQNAPGYRWGVGSIGPFTLNAGQSIPLDYCFTFARDYNGDNLSSVELLQSRVATIPSQANHLIELPTTYYSINEQPKNNHLQIHPNPAKDWIIVSSGERNDQHFALYDYSGKLLSEGIIHTGNNQMDIHQLKPGVYLLKTGSQWGRFIKM